MGVATPGLTVLDLAEAVRGRPDLVEPFLGSLAPIERAGSLAGTFVHLAAGVHVVEPLQTFFGQAAERMAPDNRTLIVAEAGSSIAYIEGCSAPIYTPHTKRSATVEIIVGVGASVKHTTIQNWSTNVDNQIEKRASVDAGGSVEWVDAVLGSRSTTTRIVTTLLGDAATAAVASMACADTDQRHQLEIVMEHAAANTLSTSLIKMLGFGQGTIASNCSALGVAAASGAQSLVRSLRVDGSPQLHFQDGALADQLEIEPAHLQYLMRRGLARQEAVALIVGGFIEPITRTLPMEYAVEWERLIELHLDRSMG